MSKSSQKTYRAVLVGTGAVGETHVHAIAATQGRVTLEAAVDIDTARVEGFARKHGIARYFTDYTAMLAAVQPDIVLIATPPAQHADMCIAALAAGAWVLCEKPLCGSLAELDRIGAAEQRTGGYTASVFQIRFGAVTGHLRRLAEAGYLGRPLVAVCNTLWYRDAAYYEVPWRGRWETELGGPTMGQGIHAMDQLLHLLGPWSEVRAVVRTLDRAIEVEDVSAVIITFANGAVATALNSTLSPRQETYLRLDYQKATVELTHLYGYTRDNWKFTPVPPAQDDALIEAWNNFPPDTGSTHGSQLNAFVADRDAGRRPLTSGDGARQTLELLTAIYKSGFTGEIVTRGSIKPGDPFYDALHGHRAPKRKKGEPPRSG